MKLTQGLLPDSKIQDGPDNEVASKPDNHDGFEFGIWFLNHPWHVIKMDKISNGEYNIRPVKQCSYGVQCVHKFTPEECDKIHTYLKTYQPTRKRDKDAMVDPNNDKIGYFTKWWQRLVDMFSNTEDPPVYYFAN